MFDIGFSELILLIIVGLVVLGPQRLPIAIRTVMGWVRTIRGLAANVQNELKQELKLQELQESIKKAEQLNLDQLSPELSKTVEELKSQANKIKADLEQKANEANVRVTEQIKTVKTQENREESEKNQVLAEKQVEELSETFEPTPEKTSVKQAINSDLSATLSNYYPPDDEELHPSPRKIIK
ncbi:Sec-independent protein translocase protein TatB [Rodentibacter caecimuris]|uniref:Sec-independent protein translocase protein TatB n=1 Tax=Rodentibacter caecimuris TaxID=1796644 RepID=A0ABX3KVQ9_9PAST|nr:twin arginine-targeting protein translocase TatB [Rodentibacter heylii]